MLSAFDGSDFSDCACSKAIFSQAAAGWTAVTR